MDINKILTPRRVNLNMQATNKEDAIQELADLLYDDGALTSKEDFIQDVWQRKAEGSTGFENHIAIPHGKSQAVKQTMLAIGRTAQDIPWETLDGSKVRCIILFVVRLEDQNTTHIRLLSQVAAALADDDVIDRLLTETDANNINCVVQSIRRDRPLLTLQPYEAEYENRLCRRLHGRHRAYLYSARKTD